MGLAKDAPPIDNRFGLIGLPFHADCCMILNILVITSLDTIQGDGGLVGCRDNNVISLGFNLSGAFW